MKNFLDVLKLNELRELSRIPSNDGEQFIHVYLNITWGEVGHINFGFGWKKEMGTREFNNLGEAIVIVKELRERANL